MLPERDGWRSFTIDKNSWFDCCLSLLKIYVAKLDKYNVMHGVRYVNNGMKSFINLNKLQFLCVVTIQSVRGGGRFTATEFCCNKNKM